MSENTWCVYKHTFPNGKVYIGVTGQNPEVRWGKGMNYQTNQKMFFDIVQYGWLNIKHEILFSGLTEGEAKDKERELIQSFGRNGREKTYNRQFADYVRPDWTNKPVNETTIKCHGEDFNKLDDAWLDPYIQQIGTYPFNVHLTQEGVEILFLLCKKPNCWYETLLIRYPEQSLTLCELWQWLYTVPEAERTVGSTFPLPEEYWK